MTTATKMIAYHGDQAVKDAIMEKIAKHRAADEIIRGTYWDGHRGCAVGCAIESGDHMVYEERFGIPVQLAHLEDAIFESLPDEQCYDWPARFMGAIKPGADLARVWPEFAIWLMVDEKWGVVNTTEDEEVKDICRRVADGYERLGTENALSDEDAEALAWDARAAWAAWDARDARDAWDAWAAWAARDARAARDAYTIASADKLIELIEGAPAEEDSDG